MRQLVLSALVALAACTPVEESTAVKKTDGTDDGTDGVDGGDGSDGSDGADGTDGGDGSDGEEPPPPESDCTDGLDNDEDGLADCDDSDCAEVAPCWWPTSLTHDGAFDFDGFEVTCETWFGDFDEQVDDCTTRYTATLTEVTDPAAQCATCDRTFYGALTYTDNSCADILDGGDYPIEAYFGFVFHSPTAWTLYGDDGSGGWESGVDLVVSGTTHSFSHTESIMVDTGECDNDPLYAGDLTITWSFSE